MLPDAKINMEIYADVNTIKPFEGCKFCGKAVSKTLLLPAQRITFFATTIFFMLSCLTLACNIWILKENYKIQQTIATAPQSSLDIHRNTHESALSEGSVSTATHLPVYDAHYRLHKRQTSRHSTKNKGKHRKCKCRGRRGKKGPRGKTGPNGERGLQGPTGIQGVPGTKGDKGDPGQPAMHPMAAHYTSDFMRDVKIDDSWKVNQNGVSVEVGCKRMWQGKVCRNRTYTSLKKQQTMTFLERSDWGNIGNPFSNDEKGRYKAKESGIYLVYFHVVFYDIAPKEEIAIMHHRGGTNTDTVLRCIEGVDIYTYGPQKYKNKKMKTCSITSVLHVQKNDIIEIKNMIAGTTIDLTKDATYFGAVLLSKTDG